MMMTSQLLLTQNILKCPVFMYHKGFEIYTCIPVVINVAIYQIRGNELEVLLPGVVGDVIFRYTRSIPSNEK